MILFRFLSVRGSSPAESAGSWRALQASLHGWISLRYGGGFCLVSVPPLLFDWREHRGRTAGAGHTLMAGEYFCGPVHRELCTGFLFAQKQERKFGHFIHKKGKDRERTGDSILSRLWCGIGFELESGERCKEKQKKSGNGKIRTEKKKKGGDLEKVL